MARATTKKVTAGPSGSDILEALTQIARDKSLEMNYVLETVEQGLLSAARRKYGDAENFRVEIDRKTGQITMFAAVKIVDDIEEPGAEITPEMAEDWGYKVEMGQELEVIVPWREFGRTAIAAAKQLLIQKVREAEREKIVAEYADRVGELVTGSVQQIDKGNIIVHLGRAEGAVPLKEQIPREKYRQGDRIRALIMDVQSNVKGPQIVLSRAHPELLRRLFELEVPEIFERIIEIKAVAREPGERSKIAVVSVDDRIDPVGACVGVKGARVQAIVRELSNERIDIVPWSSDPQLFVTRSLAPARVVGIDMNIAEKSMTVIVEDDKLSLAIGRNGQNARLASKLTGWRINILSESDHLAVHEEIEATAIAIAELPGLTDKQILSLESGGIATIQELAACEDDKLLGIDGIGEVTAEKLKVTALEFLEELEKLESELESEAFDERVAELPGSRQVAEEVPETDGEEVSGDTAGSEAEKAAEVAPE
jgi:N utilization substance protein A